MHVEIPTSIKIREGIRVNVSLSVSHAVERGVVQQVVKPEVKAKLTSNEMTPQDLKETDYVNGEPTDMISFWFVGGSSLVYRVGKEITSEDFVRISDQLNELQYRSKGDRVTSDNQVSKPA